MGLNLVANISQGPARSSEIIWRSEETTTAVIRLRAMAADGALQFPVIAVMTP